VKFNATNPYLKSRTQEGLALSAGPPMRQPRRRSPPRRSKLCGYQKWFVHRRLRPEAFGGAVAQSSDQRRQYPIHGDVLNSAVMGQVFAKYGTYLLPQAFRRGRRCIFCMRRSRLRGRGVYHDVKALFDESSVIVNPVVRARRPFSASLYRSGWRAG